MELTLTLQQVTILPQKTICKSRLDVDIRSEVIRGVYLDNPFISANMSTVTDGTFAYCLDKLGALGIIHRAAKDTHLIEAAQWLSKNCKNVAMSIGTSPDQLHLAKDLIRAGATIITIDVANGYSDHAIRLAKCIKEFSPSTKIIIGNTTDPGILSEVGDYADAIKVGIASGRACETAVATGVHHPQFSAVEGFRGIAKAYGMPIISDGHTVCLSNTSKSFYCAELRMMNASCYSGLTSTTTSDSHLYSIGIVAYFTKNTRVSSITNNNLSRRGKLFNTLSKPNSMVRITISHVNSDNSSACSNKIFC